MKEPPNRELLLSLSEHEIDEAPPIEEERTGEWTCPDCRNMFSFEDGTRTCTRSKTCKCSTMPMQIRRQRIAKGRLEQGVLGIQ
jgi:hypothetical protein